MRRRELLSLLALAPMASFATGARPQAGAPHGVKVFYTSAYAGSGHAFETTRKARWVAQSLQSVPIPGIEVMPHASLAQADLLSVHSPAYVHAVRTGQPRHLAESQGFPWDAGLWPMVLASNGGVARAAIEASRSGVAGALASGLHHARRDHGAGFCTFNGLAIAARQALARGLRRILVIDLDAHCGGGTHSLLGEVTGIRLMDVAVDGFDHYTPAAPHTLDLVRSADDYLPTIARRLRKLADSRFDLCLYNAGMDPHQHSAVGGLDGIDAAMLARRESMVFAWCRARRLPVAFVLAGGYLGPRLDQAALVALHRLTLDAASRP